MLRLKTLAIAVMMLLVSVPARAHFVLMSPTNWAQQDANGQPEKSAPCGQADPVPPYPALVLTNAVTTYRPGDTITVTISEAVMHPGWYRAVLGINGQSSLPADPTVTPGNTDCGTVNGNQIIGLTPQSPAVFPVLVDGALFHTAALNGPQSFTVKLPANMTCTKCTLQIVEFMSNHGLNNPGGCFYHHCADISIQAAAADGGAGGTGGATGAGGSGGGSGGSTGAGGSTTTGTGGSTSAGTGGSTGAGQGGSGADAATGGTNTSTGCGCELGNARSSWAWTEAMFALGTLLLLQRRRR